MLLPFNDDLRELMEGIGITHLVNEGKFEDYILTFDCEYQELIRANFSQFIAPAIETFILTPQILFPVSNELKSVNNYRLSIVEPKVCFSIDAVELREMYDLEKERYNVFFNEHYLPYLSRGLQFIKTGRKFVDLPE